MSYTLAALIQTQTASKLFRSVQLKRFVSNVVTLWSAVQFGALNLLSVCLPLRFGSWGRRSCFSCDCLLPSPLCLSRSFLPLSVFPKLNVLLCLGAVAGGAAQLSALTDWLPVWTHRAGFLCADPSWSRSKREEKEFTPPYRHPSTHLQCPSVNRAVFSSEFISGYFQDVRGKECRAFKAGRCLEPLPYARWAVWLGSWCEVRAQVCGWAHTCFLGIETGVDGYFFHYQQGFSWAFSRVDLILIHMKMSEVGCSNLVPEQIFHFSFIRIV